MNKVISFSLWGENPKYTVGAIRNAELATTVYPDWKCRFYIAKDVPDSVTSQLLQMDNVEIIHKWQEEPDWTSMFWRHETCWDDSVDVSIFRDTDSRLAQREKAAVDAWLKSDKTFHIMRDHPFHRYTMLGGMWGYKKNPKYNMKAIFDRANKINQYGTDYQFFAETLFLEIAEDKLTHDDFFEKKPFPTVRENQEFVGEVFDENDVRHPEHYLYIRKTL